MKQLNQPQFIDKSIELSVYDLPLYLQVKYGNEASNILAMINHKPEQKKQPQKERVTRFWAGRKTWKDMTCSETRTKRV